jgi:hypothetical protein
MFSEGMSEGFLSASSRPLYPSVLSLLLSSFIRPGLWQLTHRPQRLSGVLLHPVAGDSGTH